MKMDLENIPIPYMIDLHKETGDILFTDLLKSTLKLSKLEITKRKFENQLRQEKVENKTSQTQIKKLQTNLLAIGGQADKGWILMNLLEEKENAI